MQGVWGNSAESLALDSTLPLLAIEEQPEEPTPEMEEDSADIFVIKLGHAASKKIHPQAKRYADLQKVIPKEYHDFLNISDEELAMSKLPDQHPGYDFEIHLQENTCPLPPSCPYHLSREESHIMDE